MSMFKLDEKKMQALKEFGFDLKEMDEKLSAVKKLTPVNYRFEDLANVTRFCNGANSLDSAEYHNFLECMKEYASLTKTGNVLQFLKDTYASSDVYLKSGKHLDCQTISTLKHFISLFNW